MKDKINFSLNLKKIVLFTITIIEIILYVSFMFLDIAYKEEFDVTFIKYFSLLCLFPFLFINYREWDLKHILFRMAFITTSCADLFLLVINNYYIIGVSFFIVTQLCYFIALMYNRDKKILLFSLCCYSLLLLIGIIILIVTDFLELINIFVLLYFSLLVMNAFISLYFLIKHQGSLLLTLGLFLFIGCDINVGLFNLEIESEIIQRIVYISMFMFYVPSQYFIFSSLDMFTKKEVEV